MQESTLSEAASVAERLRLDLQRLYNSGSNGAGVLLNEDIASVPRRRGGDEHTKELARHVAELMYPGPNGSLGSLIKYDADAKWVNEVHRRQVIRRNQKKPQNLYKKKWSTKIRSQGKWEPEKDPISNIGPVACPMPVTISTQKSLEPFFRHLREGGNHDPDSTPVAKELGNAKLEPPYGAKMLEFEKGVLYEDGRMDLCKKVLGPPSIVDLMENLKMNIFVKHFLLGNNIIGPLGVRAIARYLSEYPDRIQTWYLAGNCIDTDSFRLLVDALTKSTSVNNIWLKRNPLLPDSALDIFRLITETKNLRTLDLEQTQLGDEGIVSLFNSLIRQGPTLGISLQNLYLNACGLRTDGASALSEYLASSCCTLRSLYISKNPMGFSGLGALSRRLGENKSLERLSLQSVGANDEGIIKLCESLKGHPRLTLLDIGQSYASEDLGVRYNWITNDSASAIADLLTHTPSLLYVNIGDCAMTFKGVTSVLQAALTSSNLLFLQVKGFEDHTGLKDAKKHDELHRKLRQDIKLHLEKNVKNRYGESMTYESFLSCEKRWLVGYKDDVRMIDSVYRNRDANAAMRGLMKLKKTWEDDDNTLEYVMSS